MIQYRLMATPNKLGDMDIRDANKIIHRLLEIIYFLLKITPMKQNKFRGYI